MDILESNIDTSGKDFKENYKHYELLVKDLKDKIILAQKGGGEEKIKLHKERMMIKHLVQVLLRVLVLFMVGRL